MGANRLRHRGIRLSAEFCGDGVHNGLRIHSIYPVGLSILHLIVGRFIGRHFDSVGQRGPGGSSKSYHGGGYRRPVAEGRVAHGVEIESHEV